jgi:predicted phosphoribosyltransferase
MLLPWDEPTRGEFGAVTADGGLVLDYPALAANRLNGEEIAAARRRAEREVRRFYAGGFASLADIERAPRLLLVDEGLDPGWGMEAAVAAARRRQFRQIFVAAPCASHGAADWFKCDADGFLALAVDEQGVAAHYEQFIEQDLDTLRSRLPGSRTRGAVETRLS